MKAMSETFSSLVEKIPDIGRDWHHEHIISNANATLRYIEKSIRDIDISNGCESALVISAGPSLHRNNVIERIVDSGYQGVVIAIDGSLGACLKKGLIPDYVLTLDPHPTRIVRWFGDHDFEAHTINDNYFLRQDLDVAFRENSKRINDEQIEIVNRYGNQLKLIVSSTSPLNVVDRAIEAGMDLYWWNPLVDDPSDSSSLTRALYKINNLPCFNTGGTVGTAAWVFAESILKARNIGVTGMDLGYPATTPLNETQTWYELHEFVKSEDELVKLFQHFTFPLTGELYYTDPTYYWYRQNFFDLLEQSSGKTYNCTEGGILFGDGIECVELETFLSMSDHGKSTVN